MSKRNGKRKEGSEVRERDGQIEGTVSVLELWVLIEHLHELLSDIIRRLERLEAGGVGLIPNQLPLPQITILPGTTTGGTTTLPMPITFDINMTSGASPSATPWLRWQSFVTNAGSSG